MFMLLVGLTVGVVIGAKFSAQVAATLDSVRKALGM